MDSLTTYTSLQRNYTDALSCEHAVEDVSQMWKTKPRIKAAHIISPPTHTDSSLFHLHQHINAEDEKYQHLCSLYCRRITAHVTITAACQCVRLQPVWCQRLTQRKKKAVIKCGKQCVASEARVYRGSVSFWKTDNTCTGIQISTGQVLVAV